ncbi:hypothetical protein SPRG_00845 [Saprolegnia parasitica CBS 223.65]|uniref:tRNA-intron lyase n=1 Tax=Saprolegnia parasitica (strain CBS 223.65) TaxID=695850 RepID=A0A067CVR8_SAPPC|nr:hypothetical protein SPRG_00845 [Saprolegnia parasitica CBS 223.65]KDO34784.1 hypothetical protein SPRG_00845 [Saprolegnia parasitica CBS 223.65]|eukprot:XP_012194451.1 hypothetical protein SPRG_00845 [Saprolegnia parasitica CBS 223.65]
MVVRACVDGKVWTAAEVQELRETHRIVCGSGGVCRHNSNKASEHRLPMQLTPAQLYVGRLHGFLEQDEPTPAVVDELPTEAIASWWTHAWDVFKALFVPAPTIDAPKTPQAKRRKLSDHDAKDCAVALDVPLHHRVFADLWSQGFYITSGSKFGGDFLIYNADPVTTHASAIIFVLARATLSPQDIVGYGRLARAVKKNCVLAYLNQRQCLSYMTLTHTSTTSRAGRPRGPHGQP